MKIVLSRKGFDSAAGGFPSPILPGGHLLSLPIPEDPNHPEKHTNRYADVRTPVGPLGPVVESLTGGRIRADAFVHLDPDLDPRSLPRKPGWRPAFGQAAAAESHLRTEAVGQGDLLLFFGWFRAVEGPPWQYTRSDPGAHLIFGWMQINCRLDVSSGGAVPAWAEGHPHAIGRPFANADVIYLAREHLTIGGWAPRLPGAGLFREVHPALQLTAPGRTRSHWRLPAAFAGPNGRCRLSYHRKRSCQPAPDGLVDVTTVGRGQEFVVDGGGLESWVRSLFRGVEPAEA